MGLDLNGVKLLLRARRCGVDLATTMMIGRQNLNVTQPDRHLLARFIPPDVPAAEFFAAFDSAYAEALLTTLGAHEIVSVDASAYEHAALVHDMNLPVPDALKMRFSLVIDGGTLEHVFNFPVAIQNCMDMTALGGCCMVIAPANNFMGHGFYQFSPELYFRVFCARNGFEVRDAIVYGAGVAEPWYQVADPNQARARVLLANTKPTYIAVLAKRTALMPLFAEPPQQSDYVERWTNTPVSTRRSGQLATELARKFLPGPLRDYTNHWLGRLRFGLSHRHYVRMRDPFDGMRAWSTPASPGCV